MVIMIFVFVTCTAGFYFLLAGLLHLPTLKSTRALTAMGSLEQGKKKKMDTLFMDGAVWMSKYIRMQPYKKSRMESLLKAAGYLVSPEVYVSEVYVKTMSVLLFIFPCLYLFPLLSLFVLLLGVMVYFKEMGKAEDAVRQKREEIDGELYRFVSTITQELKNSRDVLSMLEHYKEHAGEAFRRELDILCADMRSGSFEAALTRLETRVNSPKLSDVVRGLIGVLRGDDGAVYFQMLTHDFKQAELQRLKAKAGKIPPRIRVYSLVMLLCFIATYFVIILYEIIKSMTVLF